MLDNQTDHTKVWKQSVTRAAAADRLSREFDRAFDLDRKIDPADRQLDPSV
jgi:hypothetical protein